MLSNTQCLEYLGGEKNLGVCFQILHNGANTTLKLWSQPSQICVELWIT